MGAHRYWSCAHCFLAIVLYAAVHWRTVYGPYVEYAAVAVNSLYDILRIGAAIGTEDAYVQAAENGGYPPTQNGDIRSLFWIFIPMALQN